MVSIWVIGFIICVQLLQYILQHFMGDGLFMWLGFEYLSLLAMSFVFKWITAYEYASELKGVDVPVKQSKLLTELLTKSNLSMKCVKQSHNVLIHYVFAGLFYFFGGVLIWQRIKKVPLAQSKVGHLVSAYLASSYKVSVNNDRQLLINSHSLNYVKDEGWFKATADSAAPWFYTYAAWQFLASQMVDPYKKQILDTEKMKAFSHLVALVNMAAVDKVSSDTWRKIKYQVIKDNPELEGYLKPVEYLACVKVRPSLPTITEFCFQKVSGARVG